jgi:hypothetical protein
VTTQSLTWGSDAVTIVAGVAKPVDGAIGYFLDFNDYGASTNGSFALRVPGTPTAPVGFSSRGATSSVLSSVPTGYAAPSKIVVTGKGSTSIPLAYIAANSVDVVSSLNSQGALSYGTSIMRIGGRVSSPSQAPFSGGLYGLIAVNYLLADQALAETEAWMNGKTGAF